MVADSHAFDATPDDPRRNRRRFLLILAGFLATYILYGLHRWTLGVDFTDEGAYVSWPLRLLFGERPFVAELGTLLRPLVAYLYVIFKVHPEITLYELRLLGWAIHLAGFAFLSVYLFRLTRLALLSPLIASIPFFLCHIFGLAAPSYNTLSSDFLLVALCLRGLAELNDARRRTLLHVISGLALFLATLAHPVLGLPAALLVIWEIFRHGLLTHLVRRSLTSSNHGILAFVGAWLLLAGWMVATGAAATWWERSRLFGSVSATSVGLGPWHFAGLLLRSPFTFSASAIAFSIALGGALAAVARLKPGPAVAAGQAFALLLPGSLFATFSIEADQLPLALAQVTLLLVVAHGTGLSARLIPVSTALRLLLVTAAVAAFCYATVTYYFSPLRSWTSGILALHFPFAVGLALFFTLPSIRSTRLFHGLGVVVVGLAALGVARDHLGFIYRDAPANWLTATFRVPKLKHIRSTPERVAAVDALYDYLHPRLGRGEPFLAFDDVPLLYYLFDARPVYGLTWAGRYTQSPAALAQLNREFQAGPLPRYAVRTLVDVSNPQWAPARRTRYDNYPLNETVVTRYELECTLFPFEVWRLKSPETRLMNATASGK